MPTCEHVAGISILFNMPEKRPIPTFTRSVRITILILGLWVSMEVLNINTKVSIPILSVAFRGIMDLVKKLKKITKLNNP